MKKIVIIGLIALGVIILLIAVLSNPIRRSEEYIRKDLLKLTPVGTGMEDVLAIIESNRKYNFGIINLGSWPPNSEEKKSICIEQFIESMSIDFYLGKYSFGLKYVSAYYRFDENLKLIDITVSKETDWL